MRLCLGVNSIVDAGIFAAAVGLGTWQMPKDLLPASLVLAQAAGPGGASLDIAAASTMRAFGGMVALWGVCRAAPVFVGGRGPLVVAALSYLCEVAYFAAEYANAGEHGVPGQAGAAGIAAVMAAACLWACVGMSDKAAKKDHKA